MKFVYVLTSSIDDFYYEQFFISVFSLRLHNPDAYIVTLIDSKTKQGLTGIRSTYESYISEIVTITPPETLSQKQASRWIKTSMKKYVNGDFLYIDCDTVIVGNLNHDFSNIVDIGAVLDTHTILEKHHLAQYFIEQDKKLKFSSFKTGKRFNGGIIFCHDTPIADQFFFRWHSLWNSSIIKGSHHDMPPLNQANYEMGNIITELSGEWNCQITHNGLPFLSNAKIIHCFATSLKLYNCPFLPASIPFLSSVKKTGEISSELMDYIINPKTAFESNSRIISGEIELDVINSKFFSLLLFIRKKLPGFFKMLNSFILKTRAKSQK